MKFNSKYNVMRTIGINVMNIFTLFAFLRVYKSAFVKQR